MKVFISYPRTEHSDIAKQLEAELRGVKFQVFRDESSVQPAQAWDQEILMALKQCQIVVLLFDTSVMDSTRYYWHEVEAIAIAAVKQRLPIIPVLLGQSNVQALPPGLRRLQCIYASQIPPEIWIRQVVEWSQNVRRYRHRVTAFIATSVFILIALLLGLGYRPLYNITYCDALYEDTEHARLQYFAENASNIFIFGQNLSKVAQEYSPLVMDTIAGKRQGKARILLMRSKDNLSLETYADWSPNKDAFIKELDTSTAIFLQWQERAKDLHWNVEVRVTDMLPFSGNIIDMGLPSATIQMRPYLFRVQGQTRPVIQFTERCYPQMFNTLLDSIEAVWNKATPI